MSMPGVGPEHIRPKNWGTNALRKHLMNVHSQFVREDWSDKLLNQIHMEHHKGLDDMAEPVADAPVLRPMPPLNPNGSLKGLHLYPIMLRRVADLQEALAAFDLGDPLNNESPHFVASATLAIYNEEMTDENDNAAGLVGWVVQEDGPVWAFIPYAGEAVMRGD